MIDFLVNAELSVLEFLNSIHNPVTDRIFIFITHLGDKGILWIVAGFILCFLPKHKKSGITMLLSLLLMLIIGNVTIKPIVARIRPYEYMESVKLLIEKPTDFSFPSGHTFSSFAAAYSVFLYHKKIGWGFLIMAFLVAFSRLYLCVHFPSDVLCGAIFGIGTSYLSRYILSKNSKFKRL
ncbi:MAG: phosphatase PAP2 family protein [Clostridia bacterium]|nr:phosphatase PAP2 family protein [Clostridia bacterium]